MLITNYCELWNSKVFCNYLTIIENSKAKIRNIKVIKWFISLLLIS